MGPGLDFLVPIFGILIVLVPVIGVTAVLTLRFGLKPLIETMAAERRGLDEPGHRRLQAEVEQMGEQLAAVTDELRRLREAQEFDQKLLAPKE